MLVWIRKNIGVVVIVAVLLGWGIYSVGNRMMATNSTPPGYAYHCFDSGEITSKCEYLADPSAQSGWATDSNIKLELIRYRSGRRSATNASVLTWAGSDPAPCGFKRICFVAATNKTECLVMKVYDAACN